MSGSTIGGIIGGAIGLAFGMPQLGFMLGSLAGGIIKPQVIQGPKLGDAAEQTSQPGVPRPVVYGHPAPFAGNLIDGETKARKITVKKKQGKGGPVVKEEHFLLTSAIRICEGPISGVIRIWRNGVVIYDRRQATDIPGYTSDSGTVLQYVINAKVKSASSSAKIRIYLGTETQVADPALEAIHGVGNTPYYRGTAYMVIEDDDVTDMGGACARYMFEVTSASTDVADTSIVPDCTFHYPLTDASPGGTATELVAGRNGTYSGSYVAVGPALQKGDTSSLRITNNAGNVYAAYADSLLPRDSSPTHPDTTWSVAINFMLESTSGGTPYKNIMGYYGSEIDGSCRFRLTLWGASKLKPNGGYVEPGGANIDVTGPSDVVVGVAYRLCMVCDGTDEILYLNGVEIARDSAAGSTVQGVYFFCGGHNYPSAYGFVGCVSHAKGWNVALTPEQVAADYHGTELLTIPDASDVYYDYRAREIRSEFYNHPLIQNTSVTLEAIEADICDRCNIPAGKLDLSALSVYNVPGFLVASQDRGSDTLQPLMLAYFHDLPDYDRKIRARLRGGATDWTITDDDLIDTGDDEDPITRPQGAIEVPAKVSIVTQEPEADYAAVPQTSIRRTPDQQGTSEVTLQLAIPLGADEAKKRAIRYHAVLAAQAEGKLRLKLPREFSTMVVSDSLAYSDRRWLVTRASYADEVLDVEADYDRATAYTGGSSATGAAPDVPALPGSIIYGPTIFRVMNLPNLTSGDAVPGVYLAAQGVFEGWPGCDIEMSTDGGLTYETVEEITTPSIMGYVYVDEPGGGTPLTVRLYDAGDTLDNATTAQVAAGVNNAAFITAAGVAEIVGFEIATENVDLNWELTTLTRGLKGTTEVARVADDDFVMLQYATFLPLDYSLAGQTIYFRAVTKGTTTDNNPTTSIVFDPPVFVVDGGEVTP